ncbi:hypothetical protein HOD29_05115 [archaeon]|jgi:hypothetical protein|nr:hypothetical protein [archaeon]
MKKNNLDDLKIIVLLILIAIIASINHFQLIGGSNGESLFEFNLRQAFFGQLSGVIVFLALIPYAIRVGAKDEEKRITPNLASWFVFIAISAAICLSYWSSGAKDNLYPALAMLIADLIVIMIAFIKKNKAKMGKLDWVCISIGVASIALWYFTRNSGIVFLALFLAMFADLVGIIPTAKNAMKKPKSDRPFMWFMFGLGYCLSLFSITEHTFVNYSLPVFMTLIPIPIWLPLVNYRIKNNIPFKEWI